jgi:hypothetical protein
MIFPYRKNQLVLQFLGAFEHFYAFFTEIKLIERQQSAVCCCRQATTFLAIIKGNLTTSRFKCVRKHPDFYSPGTLK